MPLVGEFLIACRRRQGARSYAGAFLPSKA